MQIAGSKIRSFDEKYMKSQKYIYLSLFLCMPSDIFLFPAI